MNNVVYFKNIKIKYKLPHNNVNDIVLVYDERVPRNISRIVIEL